MSSTSPHDFEEHSEATGDEPKSETHEDTDLMTAGQENSTNTVHLSSASVRGESFHSINGKYKPENQLDADKMKRCGSVVNQFTSADDPAETTNNNNKREMVEDSDEISIIDQKNEINLIQHSPATDPEENYETTNQSMCMQQQFITPNSNTKVSNAQPEDITDFSQHKDTLS